jgi:hypothetical protein
VSVADGTARRRSVPPADPALTDPTRKVLRLSPSVVGPGTPYITQDALQREPLGIAWGSLIPRSGSPLDLANVLTDLCEQATALVDGHCNQPLRATLNTEELTGPGGNRVGVDPNTRVATCVMRRGPVLQVTGVQVCPARAFPRAWTPVPAGNFAPASPVIGMYGTSSPADSGEGGQAVVIAPGWVTWTEGRHGTQIQVSYVNGWPHTSLTANAAAGASSVAVDDCTGWAPAATGEPGAVGVLYDAGAQEAVTVTGASAVSGPGTLTLSAPLGYSHNAGVLLTTMPGQIRWATALFAAAQALTRGATTTTIQTTTGQAAGSKGMRELAVDARSALTPFRRVW